MTLELHIPTSKHFLYLKIGNNLILFFVNLSIALTTDIKYSLLNNRTIIIIAALSTNRIKEFMIWEICFVYYQSTIILAMLSPMYHHVTYVKENEFVYTKYNSVLPYYVVSHIINYYYPHFCYWVLSVWRSLFTDKEILQILV